MMNINRINFAFIGSNQEIIFCPFHKTNLLCKMNFGDDLQSRWWKLEEKLIERFGKKPDVESVLFMIGIQELGEIREKFSKEQKQDLMHIAVCTVLAPSGFYELSHVDDD